MLGLCCCMCFSVVAVSRGNSQVAVTVFSLRWLLLLWSQGFRYAGFSSCGLQADSIGSVVIVHWLGCSVACGFFPVSLALQGGFFTTEPPGKLSIINSLIIFSAPFSSSFTSCIPIMHLLMCLIVCHIPIFFIIFSLYCLA